MESYIIHNFYIPFSLRNLLLILFSVFLVSYLHISVPVDMHVFHILHYYLYYLIVIYASVKMGLLGGLISAFVISLLYDYEIYFHFPEIPHYKLRSFIEIVMLYTVGIFTGYFSQKLYLDNLKLKETREELAKSLNDLRNNIEEREKMEKEIARLDRLRLMGEVSFSIAHEVRNPLASIKSAANVLKKSNIDDEMLDIILKESEQLEKFVSRFNQFIRRSGVIVEEVIISDFIIEIEDYVRMYMKDKAFICNIINKSSVDKILTERLALKHIMLNLIVNAFEAVESIENGRIIIEIYNDDKYIYFSVWDNGTGIDDEEKQKIFEPFYTKKINGTGLGLPISLKLSSEINGTISLDNTNGTKFTLRLPL